MKFREEREHPDVTAQAKNSEVGIETELEPASETVRQSKLQELIEIRERLSHELQAVTKDIATLTNDDQAAQNAVEMRLMFQDRYIEYDLYTYVWRDRTPPVEYGVRSRSLLAGYLGALAIQPRELITNSALNRAVLGENNNYETMCGIDLKKIKWYDEWQKPPQSLQDQFALAKQIGNTTIQSCLDDLMSGTLANIGTIRNMQHAADPLLRELLMHESRSFDPDVSMVPIV